MLIFRIVMMKQKAKLPFNNKNSFRPLIDVDKKRPRLQRLEVNKDMRRMCRCKKRPTEFLSHPSIRMMIVMEW